MAYRSYFSHSYRPADRRINKFFWQLFAERGFFYSVDPKSKDISYPYLESMMRRCLCFAAVVPYRSQPTELNCSPFILHEYGMAVQSRTPGLVFVDKNANVSCFPSRSDVVVERYDAGWQEESDDAEVIGVLTEQAECFRTRIDELETRIRGHRDPDLHRSNKVGLLLDSDDSQSFTPQCIKQICESVARSGFDPNVEHVRLDHARIHEHAVQLDEFDLVIADVAPRRSHAWLFHYLHARLVSSIKLYRIDEGDAPSDAKLPAILSHERPTSEQDVIFWRHEVDLIERITHHIGRIKTGRIELRTQEQGDRYFDSIGRKPARVFVSNASSANNVAGKLMRALRAQNIPYFHYTEDAAIRTGDNWEEVLKATVRKSEIFVALIDENFGPSKWCEMEVESARRNGRVILPYVLSGEIPDFLEKEQASFLIESDISKIIEDVDNRLRESTMQIPDTTLSQDARSHIAMAIEDYLVPKTERKEALQVLLVQAKLWDQLKSYSFPQDADAAGVKLAILSDALGIIKDDISPRIASLRLVDELLKRLPTKWTDELTELKNKLQLIEDAIA